MNTNSVIGISIVAFKKERFPGPHNEKAEWTGSSDSGNIQPAMINSETGLIVWGTTYCGYAPLTAITEGKAFKLRQIHAIHNRQELRGFNYCSEEA